MRQRIYIFTAILSIFIFVLGFGATALAQRPDACNPVNADTYVTCCIPSAASTAVGNRCNAYERSPQFCTDFPDDSLCQTPDSNQNSCDSINKSSYPDCCIPSAASIAVGNRCNAYERSPKFCIDFPDDAMCQVPGHINGSGLPPTTPVNGSGGGQSSMDSGSAAPQSSQLTQCNKIKFKSILDILIWLKCVIVTAIIPLIFILAFLLFLWGILRYMSASSPEKKKETKHYIWVGMVGLFIMLSVWGIIKIVGDTLGIQTNFVPALQTDY